MNRREKDMEVNKNSLTHNVTCLITNATKSLITNLENTKIENNSPELIFDNQENLDYESHIKKDLFLINSLSISFEENLTFAHIIKIIKSCLGIKKENYAKYPSYVFSWNLGNVKKQWTIKENYSIFDKDTDNLIFFSPTLKISDWKFNVTNFQPATIKINEEIQKVVYLCILINGHKNIFTLNFQNHNESIQPDGRYFSFSLLDVDFEITNQKDLLNKDDKQVFENNFALNVLNNKAFSREQNLQTLETLVFNESILGLLESNTNITNIQDSLIWSTSYKKDIIKQLKLNSSNDFLKDKLFDSKAMKQILDSLDINKYPVIDPSRQAKNFVYYPEAPKDMPQMRDNSTDELDLSSLLDFFKNEKEETEKEIANHSDLPDIFKNPDEILEKMVEEIYFVSKKMGLSDNEMADNFLENFKELEMFSPSGFANKQEAEEFKKKIIDIIKKVVSKNKNINREPNEDIFENIEKQIEKNKKIIDNIKDDFDQEHDYDDYLINKKKGEDKKEIN